MTHAHRSGKPGLFFGTFRRASRRPGARARRSFRLEGLEQRLAPAVVGNLYVVGTTLVYNGNAANNAITIGGTDLSFTLSDSAGTISSTVPGFSGNGTGSVNGAVPSYIQTIAVNGQGGTDVLNIGALTTSRNLIATATTVRNNGPLVARDVTETGALVRLAATITTNGAGPLAGAVTVNGTLTVAADVTINTDSVVDGDITLNGSVAGVQSLALNAGTGGDVSVAGTVNLGGTAALTVTNANDVSLHTVVDQGDTSITAQKAVSLNGSLSSTGTVTVNANQGGAGSYGFTQVAGDITTTDASTAAVAITVNTPAGGSGSATVRGITTGAGGTVTLSTASAGGGGGILDGNGAGVVNVDTGAAGTLAASAGVGGVNLDTATANLTATVSSGALVGGVAIRNSGLALSTAGAGVTTSAGDVSVSADQGLTVAAASPVTAGPGHDVTLTTTNPASANGNLNVDGAVSALSGTATFNTTGDVLDAAGTGTVTATALNITAGSGTMAPSGSVGTAANPLLATSGSGSPLTVAIATTTAGTGVNLTDSSSSLTVAQATAQSGVINLTTRGANNNLVVAGIVANSSNDTITLTSDQDLAVLSGAITSATGSIALAPGTAGLTSGNLTVAAGTTVSTGGSINVLPSTSTPASKVESFAGTIAAGTGVTINGDAVATSVLSVSGTIASDSALQIDTSGTSGSSTLLLGGTLASRASLQVISGGATTLVANGTMSSGTDVKITNSQVTTGFNPGPLTMFLGGTIHSVAGVEIDGTAGREPTVIQMSGVTSASNGNIVVLSNGAALGDTFTLTTTGTITAGGGGNLVEVIGSLGDVNTFDIGGQITADSIDVFASSDMATSIFDISGVLNAVSGAFFYSGDGNDSFVVVPSVGTEFDFTFGGGACSVQIATSLANIVQADAGFMNPVLFTASSGFGKWTSTLGTGTVTVAPTVP